MDDFHKILKMNVKVLKVFFSKKITNFLNGLVAFYYSHTDFRQLSFWKILQSFNIFLYTHRVIKKHKTFNNVIPNPTPDQIKHE